METDEKPTTRSRREPPSGTPAADRRAVEAHLYLGRHRGADTGGGLASARPAPHGRHAVARRSVLPGED